MEGKQEIQIKRMTEMYFASALQPVELLVVSELEAKSNDFKGKTHKFCKFR